MSISLDTRAQTAKSEAGKLHELVRKDNNSPERREYERSILGVLIDNPRRMLELQQVGIKPDWFYLAHHRAIFEFIQKRWHEGGKIDHYVLAQELKSAGKLDDIGGIAGIADLVNEQTTWLGARADLLKGYFIRQQIADTSFDALQDAADRVDDPVYLLEKFQQSALAISLQTQPSKIATMGDAVDELMAEYEEIQSGKRSPGLNTGFGDIDYFLGGLKPGMLTVLGARPGLGKSALLTDICLRIAETGKPVRYVSLEMKKKEIAARALSGKSGVNSYSMRFKSTAETNATEINRAVRYLKDIPIEIDDRPCRSLQTILTEARIAKASKGLSLLVVDHLGLIDMRYSGLKTTYEKVSEISRSLKLIAMELEIPVLAAAQLNRETEREGIPRLSHLRDSGTIEQDADNVLMLHREKSEEEKDEQIIQVLIEKNRAGARGETKLLFNRKLVSFNDAPLN
eukprot:gnl/Spiro4/21025_TR10255_c0_g1_i1.p1 gnl/Spiro4/21025_TR10255_c0_g1~~gnl/Spiro4/21025_TR10255_c0_g1_i1.p1  ORF type:complete len:457 (-),score=26.98 gnl/Spiro4/21025_TR10255_c0_g1_i1:473-1843(-)